MARGREVGRGEGGMAPTVPDPIIYRYLMLFHSFYGSERSRAVRGNLKAGEGGAGGGGLKIEGSQNEESVLQIL